MATLLQELFGTGIASEIKFSLIECGGCGIPYMVPSKWKNTKVQERGSFFCPNGCSRVFTGETEAEKVKRIAEQEKRELQRQINSANSSKEYFRNEYLEKRKEVIVLKGQKTKLTNRVNHGVCPCCNRTFQNLANHMKTQHPELK